MIGRTELSQGERAKFTAFIDPRISKSSKVQWQRTDQQGFIHTIDINDGKYIGSSLNLPSPMLYVHFVCEEDEGAYSVVVDTFLKVVEKRIQLKVTKGGKLCWLDDQ